MWPAPPKSVLYTYPMILPVCPFTTLAPWRQWRQQVQKLQPELIDGDFSEMGRARREAFLCLGPTVVLWKPCGTPTVCHRKSPFWIGKSCINGPCAIAMVVYWKVKGPRWPKNRDFCRDMASYLGNMMTTAIICFFFAHFLAKPHGPPIYFDTALSSRSVVCQGKVCPQASLRPQGRGVAGSFEELGLLKIEVNTLQIGPC